MAVPDGVLEMNKNLQAAFCAHDAEGMANCYTEDCIFILGGSNKQLHGKKEIIEGFNQMFLAFSGLKFEGKNYSIEGDHVTEVGKFRMQRKDSEEVSIGSYVSLTVKRDGKWLIHYDMIGAS